MVKKNLSNVSEADVPKTPAKTPKKAKLATNTPMSTKSPKTRAQKAAAAATPKTNVTKQPENVQVETPKSVKSKAKNMETTTNKVFETPKSEVKKTPKAQIQVKTPETKKKNKNNKEDSKEAVSVVSVQPSEKSPKEELTQTPKAPSQVKTPETTKKNKKKGSQKPETPKEEQVTVESSKNEKKMANKNTPKKNGKPEEQKKAETPQKNNVKVTNTPKNNKNVSETPKGKENVKQGAKSQKKAEQEVVELNADNDDDDAVITKTVGVSTPLKKEVKEENGVSKKAKSKENYNFDSEGNLKMAKEQVPVAIKALKNYIATKNEKSLFPDLDYALNLSVIYKKPPVVTEKANITMKIPNSHRNINNTSVCVIMPDLDQSTEAKHDFDVEKQSLEWAEKIEKDHGLTKDHISKIITRREMERIAHTGPDKRKLATQYDLFLADSRIYFKAKSFLGAEFNRAHKVPILFRYSKPMSTTVDNALKTIRFPLKNYAIRSSVIVGHLGQSLSDITENIQFVIEKIAAECPGGMENVRKITVEINNGQPTIPIYVNTDSAEFVNLPLGAKSKKLHMEEVVDELSTLPDGLKVAVRKSGRVRVLKEDTSEAVLYPTVNDEWLENDTLKPTINPEKVLKKRMKRKKDKVIKTKLMKKKNKKRVRTASSSSNIPALKKAKVDA